MKNFKKVLALVLVLATLMGFATVAGAAYKDEDQISGDYTEAIKVLELIETMEGYPDGTFGPKKTITREEAAKLIAIFDNKDADISTYYTSINPFADEKGRWGESYVGYGYRAGIIAGMNATTYAPTANVTGTQFLKMALVTLGYDQEAEGFVGSSWAVNVLALARKIGLIDDLADGWKPENDLTREEAAQILLNTLNAETVEYAQEAKQVSFKPTSKTDTNGNTTYTWNGRIYLTVAGAVSTGKELYKEFKLKTVSNEDAFYRPYTKWVLDNDYDDSVEVMKAPKATFTTTFNTCELLVALGVKESDTKTEIKIENYYLNGVPQNYTATLSHTTSKCDLKDPAEADYHTFGAQGTLTQVFKMKNNQDETVYRICSIDTWLAKVTKVDKTTTSRDNHKKGTDNVELSVYTSYAPDSYQTKQWNNNNYCNANCASDSANGFAVVTNGKVVATYDDPEGLAKNDYVLMTYSWRTARYENEENKYTTFTPGVQSVDVTEGKEGRLNGFKTATLADDPSETRIDGEYITDAVHFHLGFDDSKDKANFGIHTFFYDAYGNVIGMKDGADTSKYAVLDKLYVEHSEGVATLYANVVNLDATVTKKVVVKDFTLNGNDIIPAAWTYGTSLADYANAVADQNHLTNGLNFHDFDTFYDKLGKVDVNTKDEYSLDRNNAKYLSGTGSITVVKGKPFVMNNDVAMTTGTPETIVKTNSDTQFLIRTGDVGDGEYVAYTGYNNVKSVKATGYDIVMDSDNKYAEVVYLYNNVAFTDGTVVAYVPENANLWEEEETDDGEVYYRLTVYVDGAVDTFRLIDTEANKLLSNTGAFWKFQYVDIDEVTTATVVGSTGFKLATEYTVVSYDDGILEVKDNTNAKTVMALADDCAVYSIRNSGVVEKEELSYLDSYCKKDYKVHIDFNDKNDDEVNKIVAIYVVEDVND